MKVMMLIAHGSRKQSANDEVRQLAQRVQELGGGDYDAVVPAFLELAEPDIQQGIASCIELGASEIVAVPYFLAAGRHVAQDIPGELACARAGNPGVSIEMSQYLGENDTMAGLILQCAQQRGQATR
ncbi:MAG: CbiX/SirB N-terminal domain-containing protein [Gammaproteobacteria bacterium]|nr:CbiX/SirB N-terminal domain-containing protein [Gammaproteobacteria bacterium]